MWKRYHLPVQIILLMVAVLLLYSPAFLAEPCLLDDVATLQSLRGAQITLKGLLPVSSHFSYYRPVIGLSYWLSQSVWAADPQAMHVENVILHGINVLLLFWLLRITISAHASRLIPLAASLLFAVHPIATESVNWISGRTDLIAGSCLFGACIALIKWRRESGWWLLLIGVLMIILGGMTKEVAWGFVIAVPLLLARPYDSVGYSWKELFSRSGNIARLMSMAAVALSFFLAAVLTSFWPVIVVSVCLGLTLFYRKPRPKPLPRWVFMAVTGLVAGGLAAIPLTTHLARDFGAAEFYSTFRRTILTMALDFDNSLALFSAAIAFYIKKFFLPLPLSFAITDISNGYIFAGIAVIIMIAVLAAWRSLAAILFLIGIALLLPALPLVHGEIAWTPYAERYVYISSGFWIASLAVALSSVRSERVIKGVTALCILLIPAAALATYHRAQIWQNNVTLFEDTVRKSPNHLKARVLYMTALIEAGKPAEAFAQYQRAYKDSGGRIGIRYVAELAEGLHRGGLKREAREVVDAALAKPLPPGKRHPLNNPDWQKLYHLHDRLKQESVR